MRIRVNRVSIKSLSCERQALLIRMHQLQNGKLLGVPIVNGQPLVMKAKAVVSLAGIGRPSTTRTSRNYFLKPLQIELLQTLDEIGDGELVELEFSAGMPMRWTTSSA